jgi:hypothetical protein
MGVGVGTEIWGCPYFPHEFPTELADTSSADRVSGIRDQLPGFSLYHGIIDFQNPQVFARTAMLDSGGHNS